jgi:ABC-2 type transport system ATP-binding protein
VSAPAIEVEGLVKDYGSRRVLAGVDLRVGAGEVVALLGPNGAGKTTLVEIVEGYREPDGGRVAVLGADPATGGPALKARVGLMLQAGGLDPRVTPNDILGLYAGFHLGARSPEAILALVGL